MAGDTENFPLKVASKPFHVIFKKSAFIPIATGTGSY